MTPSRTRAANQARQQATARKLHDIEQTLRKMRREHAPITYPAVAIRSGVSRTFLYQNPDANALMAKAIVTVDDQRRQGRASQDAQIEASWRERALNAEDALRAAHGEVGTQRDRIAVLLGQIRDLEATYAEETAQRIATQNTALKRQIQELSQENRSLQEKLRAARDNSRFADRRVAQLEAELAGRVTPTSASLVQ